MFKDLSLNYKFYYPYPDYLLTTQVLSDAWLTSNINLQFEDYHSFRYELFNENEALQSLIDSGDFSVFSNSFMIVISNKQSDIVYSKISTERKDEFKICTNIVKKIEGYIVEKVALTEKEYNISMRLMSFIRIVRNKMRNGSNIVQLDE